MSLHKTTIAHYNSKGRLISASFSTYLCYIAKHPPLHNGTCGADVLPIFCVCILYMALKVLPHRQASNSKTNLYCIWRVFRMNAKSYYTRDELGYFQQYDVIKNID